MKKYIFWLIGILVFAPALIGFGVNCVNLSIFAGDNNAWISFWGSYLGSIVTVILAAGISYNITRNENDRIAEIAKKQAKEEFRLKESHEAMQLIAQKVNRSYRDTNLINRNAISILRNLVEATSELNLRQSNSVYKGLYSQVNILVRDSEVDWHYDTYRANADLRYTYIDKIIYDLDFVKNYLVVQVSDNEKLKSDLEKLIECYEKMGELVKLIFNILNIYQDFFKDLSYDQRNTSMQESIGDTTDEINELKELSKFFEPDGMNTNLIETYTNEIQEEYERLFTE